MRRTTVGSKPLKLPEMDRLLQCTACPLLKKLGENVRYSNIRWKIKIGHLMFEFDYQAKCDLYLNEKLENIIGSCNGDIGHENN